MTRDTDARHVRRVPRGATPPSGRELRPAKGPRPPRESPDEGDDDDDRDGDDTDPEDRTRADGDEEDGDAADREPVTTTGGTDDRSRSGSPPPAPRPIRQSADPTTAAGTSLRRQIGTIVIGGHRHLRRRRCSWSGIELWTDAIWYPSVGYDDVFWTPLGVQVGLFVSGRRGARSVLLGNLWLAGRLLAAGGTAQAARSGGWLDRLNEAAIEAEQARGGSSAPWEQPGRRRLGWTRHRRHADTTCPTPRRSAAWSSPSSRCSSR